MLSRRPDGAGSDAETEAGNGGSNGDVVSNTDNKASSKHPAHKALVNERDELRAKVSRLETELARHRTQDESLQRTLHLAAVHAARIREDARREARLALRKARIRADETLGGLELEKGQLEDELIHLRHVADETRSVLSSLLADALEALESGETGTRAGRAQALRPPPRDAATSVAPQDDDARG